MSEWWTYTLSDFLLFSPKTYDRLLELYNLAIWPAQAVAGVAGITIIALLARPVSSRDRIVCVLLALAWLWIAWAFHWQRYAEINWSAPWLAAAFAVQAFLLVVLSGRLALPRSRREVAFAIAVIAFCVGAYPLLTPLSHRSWMTAQTFGVVPDPTAIATIAVMASGRGRVRWVLLVIPLLVCAVGALTLWAMDDWRALVVALGAANALVPSWRRDPALNPPAGSAP